jgi:hypothetical protein
MATRHATPGILKNGHNNIIQIYQTSNLIVILTEMIHDARIVPLDADDSRD